MLKRFDFFDVIRIQPQEQEQEQEQQEVGEESSSSSHHEVNKLFSQQAGVTCCVGALEIMAIGNTAGEIILMRKPNELLNPEMVTIFKAHEHRISHLCFPNDHNGDILLSLAQNDHGEPHLFIKAWKVSSSSSSSSSSSQQLQQSHSLLWVLDINDFVPKPPRDKSVIPWGSQSWPKVTCLELMHDTSQLAIGLQNGFTLLLRGPANGASISTKSHRLVVIPPPSFEPFSEAWAFDTIEQHVLNAHAASPNGWLPVTGLGFAIRTEHSKNSLIKAVWLWISSGPDRGALRAFNTASILSSSSTTATTTSSSSSSLDKTVAMAMSGRAIFSRFPKISQNLNYGEVVAGPLLDDQGCSLNCCCISESIKSSSGTSNDEDYFVMGKMDRIAFFSPEDPGACYAVFGEKKSMLWFKNYLCLSSSLNRNSIGGGDLSSSSSSIQIFDFENKFIALNFVLPESESVRFMVASFGNLYAVSTSGFLYQFSEKSLSTKLEDLVRRNLFSVAIAIAHSSQADANTIMNLFRLYGDHLYSKGSFEDAVTQYCRTIGFVEPSYVICKFLDSPRLANLAVYLEALHIQGRPSGDHTTLLLNCYIKQKKESKIREFVRNDEFSLNVDAALPVLRQSGYFSDALYLASRSKRHGEYIQILLENMVDFEGVIEYLKLLEHSLASEFAILYGKKLMSALPNQTTDFIKSLFVGTWNGSANITINNHPEDFFPIFIENQKFFLDFLLYLIDTLPNGCDSPLVWNALLELKLSMNESPMQILTDPRARYDSDQALILMQQSENTEGLLYLYERLQMYDMLIQYYMKINDGTNVVLKAKKHAPHDASVWVQVLMFFAKHPQNNNSSELRQVLHHIERLNILPPLLVIQVLSTNPQVKLSSIRSYIVGQLEKSLKFIEEDEADIRQLREDTNRMQAEAHNLQTEPQIFKATKCAWTGAPLELPTVHFLSGCSYNLGSIPQPAATVTGRLDNLEDPMHAREQQAARDILTGLQRRSADKTSVDEEFFSELEDNNDGFTVAANAFGLISFKPA